MIKFTELTAVRDMNPRSLLVWSVSPSTRRATAGLFPALPVSELDPRQQFPRDHYQVSTVGVTAGGRPCENRAQGRLPLSISMFCEGWGLGKGSWPWWKTTCCYRASQVTQLPSPGSGGSGRSR